MKRLAAICSFAVAILAPTAAFAYVGPGAGLSLLGALWALVAAIATAVLFIVAWPIRKAMRRRQNSRVSQQQGQDEKPPLESVGGKPSGQRQ
ncbi:hypothetical protein L598_001000000230 [Mesorhizobium sp. J18]|uniref:hypothetical protein n=1 Tax=Mesorhizobium sp. J18 TaxID=935263 RepID=UPI00119C7BAF|nr:hypothetical protein [Mesorhizobium sp. J18]TWH00585.1 hypothetical protein L598_001000000230 [Mesorhizobium sp. J18]